MLYQALMNLCGLVGLTLLAAACVVPGQFYRVAEPISGVIRSQAPLEDDANLLLVLMHREGLALHGRQEARPDASGTFVFDATDLDYAGHEYSKFYRVFLHLQEGAKDRVVWRAVFSRREMAVPIRLDCDLDRPLAQGQPCQVVDPLAHPWLISEGKRQFRRLCSDCHGQDGEGDPSMSASLSPPPDLARIAARHGGRFDRARIAEWVEGRTLLPAHGSREMPIWGEALSAEFDRYAEGDALIGATLDPILAYLESLQGEPR